jgi:hypothetical protein
VNLTKYLGTPNRAVADQMGEEWVIGFRKLVRLAESVVAGHAEPQAWQAAFDTLMGVHNVETYEWAQPMRPDMYAPQIRSYPPPVTRNHD